MRRIALLVSLSIAVFTSLFAGCSNQADGDCGGDCDGKSCDTNSDCGGTDDGGFPGPGDHYCSEGICYTIPQQ